MKRLLAVGLLVLGACPAPPPPPQCPLPTGLPVFPGAVGYGTTTPGGRGGRVIEVTTLASSGPGSFVEALLTKGPRLVVFRVGGVITLEEVAPVTEPFLTVAGQTAPGDGVLVNGAGLAIFTHDVLIQHVRFRPGTAVLPAASAQDNDAITILGKTSGQGADAFNVVLDHVSLGWSEDEVFSTYFEAHDVTVSWSLIAEGLASPRHNKGAHSAGFLYAEGTRCASLHHSLMAHNGFRNPVLKGGGRFEVVNNVIYDWEDVATEISPLLEVSQTNLVGNVYLPGPKTSSAQLPVSTSRSHPVNHLVKADTLLGGAAPLKIFAQGNLGPGRLEDMGDEWSLVANGYGAQALPAQHRQATAFEAPISTFTPTAQVKDLVLSSAGASKPRRDAIDARVVNEVRTGTGTIIASENEVGGFPSYAGGTAPADDDHDGMSDAWERANGLDPADPTDGSKDADGDGYTNVEAYLFSLL